MFSQTEFFERFKETIPTHISLPQAMMDILGISLDGAYRRINGKTSLALEEALALAGHFNFSLDSLVVGAHKDIILFKYVSVHETFSIEDYLLRLNAEARAVASVKEAELYLVANDLTIFQLLQIPELAAFKIFFWLKSSLGAKNFKDELFRSDLFDSNLLGLSEKIIESYIGIKTIEVVGISALDSFIRQIQYYLEMGFIQDTKHAIQLYDLLADLVEHFRKEAELGYKFKVNGKQEGRAGNFSMYANELLVIDGMVLAKIDEKRKLTYFSVGPLNYLVSTQEQIFQDKYEWLQNLIQRSRMLSGPPERDRIQFFNKMKEGISKAKKRIRVQV